MRRGVAALVGLVLGLAPLGFTHAEAKQAWTTRVVQWGPRTDDHLDVYAPGGVKARPAFLYVHGGGWKRDDIDPWVIDAFEKLARQEGWVLGIAYYPTTRTKRHNVRYEEVHAVARGLATLRHQPGVDPSKVSIYGASAGGNLGSLVAYLHPHEVAALVSSSGPSNMAVEETNQYVGPLVDRFMGETFAESQARGDGRYAAVSPAATVRRGSPPTFVLADRRDPFVPVSEFREERRALARAHVRHRVLLMPGQTHCPNTQQVPGTNRTAQEEAIAFVKAVER